MKREVQTGWTGKGRDSEAEEEGGVEAEEEG